MNQKQIMLFTVISVLLVDNVFSRPFTVSEFRRWHEVFPSSLRRGLVVTTWELLRKGTCKPWDDPSLLPCIELPQR